MQLRQGVAVGDHVHASASEPGTGEQEQVLLV